MDNFENTSSLESNYNQPEPLTKEFLKKNFTKDITSTFMRHGQPGYSDKEKEKADWEGTLTKKGIKQVENSAHKLAQEIKKNNEQVIILSSTRKRADQTATIITKILKSHKITVLNRYRPLPNGKVTGQKHRPTPSLKAPDVTKDFWDIKPKDEFFVRIWKELYEKGELPDGVETPEDSEKKFKRVLKHNMRIAKFIKNNPDAPKIRILNIGHFETVTPLLQEAYGEDIGIDKNKGPGEAEFLNVEVQLCDNLQNPKIEGVLKLNYEKGIEQENNEKEVFLTFDNSRKIKKIDN